MRCESPPAGLLARARSTPNRGETHLFLGHPRSDGCDKTAVEPGNSSSPGVWTCGVSLWLAPDGEWSCADLLPAGDVGWVFVERPGGPPIVVSRYAIGPVQVVHRLGQLGAEGARGVDYHEVRLAAERACGVDLGIVVRDVGPAGGCISGLEWDGEAATLAVEGGPRLVVECPELAYRIAPADEDADCPAAALTARLRLKPGREQWLRFKVVHGFAGRPFGGELARLEPPEVLSVELAFGRIAERWADALPTRVFAPDPRVTLTWERCAYHILAAMECGLPRIGAVNYPVLWVRDCVIVLRALDLMGRHDLARAGNDYLAPLVFGGGFGAESDAPGEGIWSLVSHARCTGDDAWLARQFPHLRRRAELLERMLGADRPLRALSESRDPRYINTPGVNLLCLPARHGLIHGRMDWHSPDFYINCWAQCGLRLAAEAARRGGHHAEAERWGALAAEVDRCIARHLLPEYGDPRDPAVAPYPTGALSGRREELRAAFAGWYRANRLGPNGVRRPEKLWTYFEAAQAHNAVLLGLREEAWVGLSGMMAASGPWDVSAYVEGKPGGGEQLPYRNDRGARGWLRPDQARGGNMPHNWTSAELINLIRDLFVIEQDQEIVLGVGVPRDWLRPGSRFGVRRMATERGEVSYTAEVGPDGSVHLDYDGPEPYRTAFPRR